MLDLTATADLLKAATADTATDAERATVADIRKALGIDALAESIDTVTTKAATAEDLTKVAVRLAKVESTVVNTGPVRVRPPDDTAAAAVVDAALNKAAEYDRIADGLVDRDQAAAYRQMAVDLRNTTRTTPTR